ncbi:MAG: AAA family ATPase [Lachnospiraceae bacterium]|nr:AAA family ATPase [Lachnospiraceae bacterium]
MPLKKIELSNVTVFEQMTIPFGPGINVLIGENGLGKTHIMKLLYAACQASKRGVSFPHKTVLVFCPEQSNIRRLVNRDKDKCNTAKVRVYSDVASIGMTFTNRTKAWKADTVGEENWEKQMMDLSSVFIPAKEILSNAWNLESAAKMGNVEFDDTYLDIIAAAKVKIAPGKDADKQKKYLDLLRKINRGTVTESEEHFYLKPGNQARLEFNLVAEGMRKIALLWQLMKNGIITSGSVLFWDEPEANMNPKYIPVIVDMLLMLQREGIQVFVSTHDYFLGKYFDVRRKEEDEIVYHSLYRSSETGRVELEQKPYFKALANNVILDTFMALYREEIRKVMQ